MKLLAHSVMLLFFFSNSVFAQSELPEFGVISEEEKNLKECVFDKEAEAVIIFDDAMTDHDENYNMITKRRVRIKILNDNGIAKSNIVIPFYSESNYEFIQKVEGVTCNVEASGQVTLSMLDKKTVFTQKRDKYYSFVKFAMPAVRAGSIIEYRYESIKKSYNPRSWEFQSDIPTMQSRYLLQIPPNAEFAYSIQKKRDMQIRVRPIADKGQVYFEMNNVPALRYEPYMDAAGDYIQRVLLQFSGYTDRTGHKQEVNTTWRSLAYDLATDKDFGGQLDKSLKADDVKKLADEQVTEFEKIKVIYEFVRDNIAWNGYYSKYAENGLKNVFEKKTGAAAEINLLLINLLRANGIESYPLLVAERDFGKIDSTYPFLDRFNKVVAYVVNNDKKLILDATQKNYNIRLIPYPLLNTLAFIVDKKKYALIRIGSSSAGYKNNIVIHATITKDGTYMNADAIVESMDYSKLLRTADLKEDNKKFVSRVFSNPHPAIVIDSFFATGADDENLPLKQHLKFQSPLNESGGFIPVSYNLFTGLASTPFISSIRFSNVNFGFPFDIQLEANIKLPVNCKIDALPGDMLLENKTRDIAVTRVVKQTGNEVQVKVSFKQVTTLVHADYYNDLKDFYKKMTDMLNEPIVIKREN